jgi:hypothetical protein
LAPATSSSSVCHTRQRAVRLRVVSLLTVVLLTSAAPSGAALPEDRATACNLLGDDPIFVGVAGEAFPFRPYEADIERARAIWLTAQAESDSAPKNIELLRNAIEAHAEFEHRENMYPDIVEIILTPVTVHRPLRGVGPGRVFVDVQDAKVEPGRSYLFYGRREVVPFYPNVYGTQLPPKELSAAHLELQVLEAAPPPELGMLVGTLGEEDASDRKRVDPLAGMTLRLATPAGLSVEVVTDAEGIFTATNVPPGLVTVTPLLTDRLAVANRSAATVTLRPGDCKTIALRVALNGRIRGRITDSDGKPRTGLPVQLLPAGYRGFGPPSDERYRASTNDRGEFEFSAIPPGSYLVGHQIHRSDAIPPGGFPPSTYFPGVTSPVGATPVVVGNATVHNGIDFTVVW